MSDVEIYHVRIQAWDCAVRVVINGMEIARSDGKIPVFIAPPINPYLTGRNNRLQIILSPPERMPYLDALDASALVRGDVAVFREDETVGASHGGERVATIDVSASTLSFVGQKEATYEVSFPAKGDVFKWLSRQAPQIYNEDWNLLLDYAVRVHGLAAKGDDSVILSECTVRTRDYAVAYAVSIPAMTVEFAAELRELLAGQIEPMPRSDVQIIPHCDGRVCELARWKRRPLITAVMEQAGETVRASMRVFVGKIDGAICIVR